MVATLLPNGEQQFLDQKGIPYAGGTVSHFVPGTLTPKDTFQDQAGAVLNENPLVLDAAGRAVIMGVGTYRQILNDADGDMIWDEIVMSPLPADAISDVMAPVVAATSLQQARDLMGITAAIQAATAAINLMPGPAGPVGPQGPIGPTGPAGTAGASSQPPQSSGGNPGYLFEPSTGFLASFGNVVTAGNGVAHVNFAKPYLNLLSVVANTSGNPINVVVRTNGAANGGFDIFVEDTNNTIGLACKVYWAAFGFSS